MTIKPCENYSLCQNMIPNINFQSDYCMQCGDWFKLGFGWNKLEFSGEEKECKSCKKSTKQLKFPTECGHWVCVDCFRDSLFWDERRYHLNPTSFGGPSCPNNCNNPVKGAQCYCDEYYGDNSVIENWGIEDPINYELWQEAESESIDQGDNKYGIVNVLNVN